MEHLDLIVTLTGGLAAALVFGYLTQLLRLSPIVGYLLAGIAVGTHTPGFVANHHIAEQFAEVGVILLMFSVGLHFHLEDLLAVKRVAVPGAILKCAASVGMGICLALTFGWAWTSGIVFGLAMGVASTVVLTRVLADNRELHTPLGHTAVGWLIVEDILVVLVLVILPILFGPAAGETSLWPAIGLAAVKVFALVGLVFFIGGRFLPWFFARVARTSSRELFTLAVLVTVLGIAVGSAALFGVSMALGSFLAGMIIGRSEYSVRAASEALPMRDAFAVLFFVSVGMLLNPAILLDSPGVFLATLLVVVAGKTLASLIIVAVLGLPVRTAVGASVALAQIGEFSFILGAVGKQLGLLDDVAINALVGTSIVSITLSPILYRLIGPISQRVAASPGLEKFFRAQETMEGSDTVNPKAERGKPRAIIVGYGPIGQTVSRILRENNISPAIIELNIDTVKTLHAEGVAAYYGDAGRLGTLESAGAAHAASLILTASSIESPAEVIRLAKELNPSIRIMARSAYVREIPRLQAAGCERVFSGEGEVALAIAEEILRDLGATTEEIARERRRVTSEVFST